MRREEREYRQMVDTECEEFGGKATFAYTGRGHLESTIWLGGSYRKLTTSGSPSDHRGMNNARRDVRRALGTLARGGRSGAGYR